MIFKVTLDDVGRNGLTKKDLNKWAFMDFQSKVFYLRATREECEELRKALTA
jgi:hypothetical protein